jgi:hypothetical protein
MLRPHLTRNRLGFLLAVAAGLLLGAVLGQPGLGHAAGSNAKPSPKTPPTISGPAEVGITLVATHGTWKNNPTSFHYQWVRCDAAGNACLGISGATAKIYTVTYADVGHTLRVSVTAHNGSGSTTASSAQTTVVPAAGCPPGTGAIAIGSLTPPARLAVSAASVSPRVRRSSHAIHLHVTITACNGRPVVGASVFATAVPYNQFAVAQAVTGANGTVVLTEGRRAGFPVSRQQRLLAVFVRTWKQGEPTTGGISSSKVVAFRFGH